MGADPMSEDELDRSLQMAEWQVEHGPIAQQYAADFVLELLREVKRLHTENAAMHSLAEAVAPGKTIYFSLYEGTFCVLCNGYVPGNVCVAEYDLMQFPHKTDCPVVRARAFLAGETKIS